MDVAIRKIGSVTIVDLNGRLTVEADTASLHEVLGTLLRHHQKQVVLNMARVPSLDCWGIGQIVICYRRVYEQGGTLKLLKLGRRMRRLLEMSKLLTIIDAYEHERDAVTSFCDSSKRDSLFLRQSLNMVPQGLTPRTASSS